MADEQNTVPIDEKSPYAEAEKAVADTAPVVSYIQETTPMPNPYPSPEPTTPIATSQPYGAAVTPPPAPTFAGSNTQATPSGSYANAQPTPVYTPEQVYGEVNQLSGGMKFGWLLIGMLMGIPGMLIAWLTNADGHPQVKKDAILWSVIGFAINVVLVVIFTVVMIGILAAAAASAGGYYSTYPF